MCEHVYNGLPLCFPPKLSVVGLPILTSLELWCKAFFWNEKIIALAKDMIFQRYKDFHIYIYFNRVKILVIFNYDFLESKLCVNILEHSEKSTNFQELILPINTQKQKQKQQNKKSFILS